MAQPMNDDDNIVVATEEIIHFEKIPEPQMKKDRDLLPQSIRDKYASEGMKKRKEKEERHSRKKLEEVVV